MSTDQITKKFIMLNKSLRMILSGALPLAMLVGCAHRQPESAAAYDPLPAAGVSPTSDGSDQRVYSATITAPGGASGNITRGSASASGPNREIGETIRKEILSDPKMVPYPSKVLATMDPASDGTVVLTGSVQTKGVKEKLVKRISEVPGVSRVEDKLILEVPKTSREVDLGEPPK
jgi:hypothetical protein